MGIISERVTALLHYQEFLPPPGGISALSSFYGAFCLAITELLVQLHCLTPSASVGSWVSKVPNSRLLIKSRELRDLSKVKNQAKPNHQQKNLVSSSARTQSEVV